MITVKHPFQSAKADGVDPTFVQPSNWNANHTLTGAITNYISGLTLSTAGSSATATIAAGEAAASDNTDMLLLASSLAKTTASWVAGAGGALDTGAIAASTWYHVFLIKNPTSGVVDVLFSTNVSAPTMPTGYTLKRRIGSMKTNGSSQWLLFRQVGNFFYWDASPIDALNVTPASTNNVLVALSVPPGVNVFPIISFRGSGNAGSVLFSLADGGQVSNTQWFILTSSGADVYEIFSCLATNTSRQITVCASTLTAVYTIFTAGWIDMRGAI